MAKYCPFPAHPTSVTLPQWFHHNCCFCGFFSVWKLMLPMINWWFESLQCWSHLLSVCLYKLWLLPVLFSSTNFSIEGWRDWLNLSARSVLEFPQIIDNRGHCVRFLPKGCAVEACGRRGAGSSLFRIVCKQQTLLQPTQTLILGFYLLWISVGSVPVAKMGALGFFFGLSQVYRNLSIE